jgi:hypothetical protein
MAEPGCRTLVGKLASPSNQLAASGASIMVHVSVMLVLLGVGSTCTHTHTCSTHAPVGCAAVMFVVTQVPCTVSASGGASTIEHRRPARRSTQLVTAGNDCVLWCGVSGGAGAGLQLVQPQSREGGCWLLSL